MKPEGLKATTITMCLMNLAGFVFLDPQAGHLSFQIFLGTVIVTCSYVVLWFYWNGKNWARILVILTSAIGLLNLFALAALTPAQKILAVAEGLFSVFLICWLNTKPVRDYFKGANSSTSAQA